MTAGAALTAVNFDLNTASGTNGQFIFKTANHILYYDANGPLAGQLYALAVLDNAVIPALGDFVFI